ncbi:MAG: Smr/MutS family protein [Thermodesulfobacteriota bacterium]
MDEHTLNLLEYGRLLELLAAQARSEPGAAYCRGLSPDLDFEAVRRNWRLVDEARAVLGLEGYPPLEDLPRVDRILGRLGAEGMVLRPLELLALFKVARTSRLVRSFIKKHGQTAPELAALAELPVFKEFEQAGEVSLGPEGEVLDSASPELARVRREFSGLRGTIQDRLTGFMRQPGAKSALQDEIITTRGGRYVIPVKTSQTREVPGLVHDYSSSGQTAYVEPLEMVEDNNRLNFLRRQEKREVERVLARLSSLAAASAGLISQAADLLARIDAVFAMAALSRRQRGLAPELALAGGVDLRQARHPLLETRLAGTDQPVVPVDLRLPEDERTLVISGVNAGGKTVALKTLGLLVLMARTGLHLPVAEGSRLVFFDRVLAVIGDEQDLETDLSTFSGHVRRLSWILERAGEKSLVLLDELGTGTDPVEGAALALAVLDELTGRRTWVVTATHYHLLKNWARLTHGAANASVRTDEKGRPSYGLTYGAVGFSSGLAMARELGLDREIVARAERYLDEGQKKTLDLMQRLEEERVALARSRAEHETLVQELSAAAARSTLAEKKRADKFNREMRDLTDKVHQALHQAEREFKDLKRRFKAPDRSPVKELAVRFKEIKSELRESLPARVRTAEPLDEVRPGDRVLVVTLGRTGRVRAVNPARAKAEVDLDGCMVQAPLSDLARPGPEDLKKERGRVNLPVFTAPPRELNLLGLTVEEALPEVEKSLDQAQLGGLKNLAIIHGVGTGRLREAVREYLSGSSLVKDFHPGERRLGGEGVTLVELMD